MEMTAEMILEERRIRIWGDPAAAVCFIQMTDDHDEEDMGEETGQICADSIGETVISGVGGQHDFMYGAALSEGGKCFIALPSTTAKGQSKIVSHLQPGAGVVTTRFQAQYIATEYGIVYLRNLPLAERAKALISIAHPSVREDLEREAVRRFGIGFLRLR